MVPSPRIAPALAVLAAGSFALLPARAAACECSGGLDLIVPADGATDVPTNTRLWVGDGWAYLAEEPVTVALDGPAGSVASTVSTIEVRGGRLHVITPEMELAAGTRYELRLRDDMDPIRFTTGAGPATEAPAAPRLHRIGDGHEAGFGSSCGEYSSVTFEVEHGGVIVFLDVDGWASLDGLSGRVSDVLPAGGEVRVGVGDCQNNTDAGPGDTVQVRAMAVDLAGNASPWIEPVAAELPAGCGGCGAGQGAGVGSLLALALLARRRRSRGAVLP